MQNGNNKSRQTFPLQTPSRLLPATHSITHFREREGETSKKRCLVLRTNRAAKRDSLPKEAAFVREWEGG